MANVLVVDDDPAIRRVLRLRFERAGHVVDEAASGFEALTAINQGRRPDAVVCDVLMPGMNGLDFYRRLAEEVPALKKRVVFLTGANREPAVADRIEQLGVPLLGKHDDLQLVVDAVRVALLVPAE
ncbi:MAG: response regulator [Gemmatimonadales bacterium]